MEFSVSLASRIQVNASLNPNAAMIGITGPSGAGKSSLLASLAGAEPNANISVNWYAKAEAVRVGLVFQQPMLFPHLTVQGNLDIALKRAKAGGASIDNIINGCECAHLLSKPVAELSGGEGQRVALARALLNGPDILLLDESLSAMDVALRHRVLSFLSSCAHEGYFRCMYVSHDWQDLSLFSQALVVIKNGALQSAGDTQAVLNTLSHSARGENPCALIEGQWLGTLENVPYTLHKINVGGEVLYSSQCVIDGEQARFALYASDVSLSLVSTGSQNIAQQSSMLNGLNGVIHTIDADTLRESGKVLVSLKASNNLIYARISALSLERLALHTGQRVIARFKAH